MSVSDRSEVVAIAESNALQNYWGYWIGMLAFTALFAAAFTAMLYVDNIWVAGVCLLFASVFAYVAWRLAADCEDWDTSSGRRAHTLWRYRIETLLSFLAFVVVLWYAVLSSGGQQALLYSGAVCLFVFVLVRSAQCAANYRDGLSEADEFT